MELIDRRARSLLWPPTGISRQNFRNWLEPAASRDCCLTPADPAVSWWTTDPAFIQYWRNIIQFIKIESWMYLQHEGLDDDSHVMDVMEVDLPPSDLLGQVGQRLQEILLRVGQQLRQRRSTLLQDLKPEEAEHHWNIIHQLMSKHTRLKISANRWRLNNPVQAVTCRRIDVVISISPADSRRRPSSCWTRRNVDVTSTSLRELLRTSSWCNAAVSAFRSWQTIRWLMLPPAPYF